MSEEIGDTIALKLEEVGPGVAVTFEIGMDSYFDVIRGLVDNFAPGKGLKSIYITSSVPSSTLLSAMEALEVNTKNIMFVDCISQLIGGNVVATENVVHVENPTMLENIILKVDFLARKLKEGGTLVIVDSISSFAIHNDVKILSEFLQVLLSGLKSRGAYPVMISIAGQTKPEVREMIGFLSDQVISLQGTH